MPELLEEIRSREVTRVPSPIPGADVATERRVREELRRQIARLERRLAEVFTTAFPRQGFDWRVGSPGGPRVLGVEELERVRDALAYRVREAQTQLERVAEEEEASRGLLESMIATPDRYRWVRVSNDDIGERGCRHWHSRPRWGVLGMLMGWWRVKVSSGCPLAEGRGSAAPRSSAGGIRCSSPGLVGARAIANA